MDANSTMLDKYAARLLMVSFVLPMQLQIIGLFLPCAYFIFRTFQDRERTPVANYITAIGIGALYLLYLLAVPLTPPQYRGIVQKMCEYRVAYLVMPIVVATISPQKIKIILGQLVWFVYGALATCLITNIRFVAKYVLAPGGFHGVNHVTYRIFFEDVSSLHPTYISMYLVFGTGILLVQGMQLNRALKYTMFYASLAFLLPLLAKSPLIALVFICIHTAWLRRKRLLQYKWMFAGVLLVIALSYLFVPFVSQRVNEMAGIGTGVKENLVDNSVHERKMILSVDLAMVKQYWATGCGPGRLQHLLDVRYLFYSLHYGRNIFWFDPHNEYLYQWISFGLAGILVFGITLIAHFIKALRARDNLYIYLLLILCITFFTESVLSTQHGVILYAFFTSILFFNRSKEYGKSIR